MMDALPGFGWNLTTVFFVAWLAVDVVVLVSIVWLTHALQPLIDRMPKLIKAADDWTEKTEADKELDRIRGRPGQF